jgi:hypothetical protein
VSETALVRAVIQYINARGGFAWRNQSGRLLGSHKGKTWAVHMGVKGLPDVVGIWPMPIGVSLDSADRMGWGRTATGQYAVGRLIAVECKRPGNKPTRVQEATMEELRKRGALVVLAYSVTDVEKALA